LQGAISDTKKNLDAWNEQKKIIQCCRVRSYFKERELWWSSLGANVGHEQDGKNKTFERRVLVLKKFNQEIGWMVPIPTQPKRGKYYFAYRRDGRSYWLILSQVRLMDAKRLKRKIGVMGSKEYQPVVTVFQKLLAE